MRFRYLTLFCLFVVFAASERKAEVKGIDLDLLAAKNPQLSLVGDNVRIRVTPATEVAGVAGRIGNVAGFTIPSQTGGEVIGEIKDDLAFSVIFENHSTALVCAGTSRICRSRTEDWKFRSAIRG